MIQTEFNILWIDDEHETLKSTIGRAKRKGIKLWPFKSLEGGMSELDEKMSFYDGILLDAKFFENEDDVKGSEDTINVHRAKDRLLQLKKKFEIFVLTGQAEAYDNETFQKSFTKVYKKGSDSEMDRLFTDIIDAARRQPDTQIRHEYRRVFDVCTEKYIGEAAANDILNLLKIEGDSNAGSHFNAIRKVIEDLFLAFHKFKLLPSEFVNHYVALTPTQRFLSGKIQSGATNDKFKIHKHLEDTHLPVHISDTLKYMLDIVQAGSHRSKIDKHTQELKTPFLFKSVLFQLFHILIWFKMYVDSNPKTENWELIEANGTSNGFIKGMVINLNRQREYAFFKPNETGENVYIPKQIVDQHSLNEGMSIEVKVEEYLDKNSGEPKKRVILIKAE